jgi:alkylation response protein AidB-like acyl-CoA dehydrogenase
LYFSEEHIQFRQSLRDFLNKEVVPFVDEWEEVGNPPREIWKKFGDMGYFGLRFPEKYGGLNLDFFYDVILLEELAKINSAGTSAALGAHSYLSLAHLNNEGSEKQKQNYLVPGIAGEIFGCLAISEPGGGSDVASMRTTAVKDGNDWIINGSKTFITNGVLSDYLISSAKTEPELTQAGISMFVIDRNTKGLSATRLDKLGWRASDTAELAFDEMRVPGSALLGAENQGFYYIMQQFALERLIMAIGGVAGSEYALQYGLDYMREREAFGRPLTKFQELRHRVAQLAAEIEQQKQFVYYLCDRFTKGEYIVKEAAMAKLLATQLSDKVTFEIVQFLGGYGYMEDYQAARMFRDSRLGQIGGGTSEIMKEIIAKMAIDDVKYS